MAAIALLALIPATECLVAPRRPRLGASAPSGGDARYYLGIDLSTQSCTAIVVDAALDVAHRASVNFDASFPAYGTSNGMHATDDGVATSPVAMWLDGLDAVLELIPASLRQQVDGVSFSGQQHGSVYWSAAAAARLAGGARARRAAARGPHTKRARGRPIPRASGGFREALAPEAFAVADAPIWADASTQDQCDALEAALGGPGASRRRDGGTLLAMLHASRSGQSLSAAARAPRAANLFRAPAFPASAEDPALEGLETLLWQPHGRRRARRLADERAAAARARAAEPLEPRVLLRRAAVLLAVPTGARRALGVAPGLRPGARRRAARLGPLRRAPPGLRAPPARAAAAAPGDDGGGGGGGGGAYETVLRMHPAWAAKLRGTVRAWRARRDVEAAQRRKENKKKRREKSDEKARRKAAAAAPAPAPDVDTDAYTLGYDYLPAFSYSTAFSYSYDDDSTNDDCSCSTDDSAATTATICVLRDTTVCWGNLHRYIERTGTSPFDDIQGGRFGAPALGDLDDDGDLDLVVGEEDGIVSAVLKYYENIGNATSPTYEAVTGAASPFYGIDVGWRRKPALADVDGDGDLDLVVGDDDRALNYYENVGSAASPSYKEVDGDASPFDGIWVGEGCGHALGDVDGDGDLDLFVCAFNYYENVGSAASPSYKEVDGDASPFGVIGGSWPALADLDGDGDLDLVVGEYFGALYYYENVGSAASPSYAAVTGSANPFDGIDVGYDIAPALADLDGDGDLDLVVGRNYGALYYYEIVGPAASPNYAALTGTASPFDGIDVGDDIAPALADLDGDGDLDLVVGEEDGALNYFENVGSAASPSYVAVTGTANPFDGIDVGDYSAPAFGDVDGDGDLDLVVGCGMPSNSWDDNEKNGVLYYYENIGSAASPTYAAVTGAANPFDGIDVGYDSKPAFADLDDDGDLDLVVGKYDGALYYYENIGSAASPSYEAVNGSANPFDGIDVGYNSAPALADLDGDGDLDLFVGESTGVLNYYMNVGSATAPSYAAVPGTANPFDGVNVGFRGKPAFADLDGDGDLDLVVGEYFGGLNFFANGYCTQGDTACRKKGLCDLTNVVFAEASCQCLGGFDHEVPGEIEQCGECQAGFYGKTCEPCPQGGDEDPNAPRLTDTCGVAGSGRSRGKCDDGVRGDGTCACFGDVFSGSGCTEGTCPAGTVETATFDGYYNNAACTPCAAPFYAPDAGATSCKLADAGFFVDSLGASKQVACDAGKYSGS
ncbi:serralysin-like protein [Aureococcus anophagefferens]|uniref:Serralysin-like protein n=1 Tax=Aureococcus anophagefferens TaxID=44056 RepID=A0ABR1G6L2_AURAN